MEEEERVVRAVDAFKTRPSPAALRPFVPDFVLKDKVVLVFAGYFAEAVKEKEEAPAAGRPTGLPSNASNARGASNASAASTSNPLIGPSGVPSLSVPRSVHPWVAAHPQAKPWATDEPKPVPAAVVQQPIYTPAPPAKPNIIKPSTQIIRRIVLSFFVEDGSLAIVEPKRGPLVSRQKVPRNLADRRIYIEEKDLDLGREIEVYGKKIVLCDADEFTKHYYSTTLRRPLHPAVPLPEDSLAPTKPAPSPRAAQAAVDGPHNDPLARFLLYDRSVLRFFGVWLENGKPTQKEVILHLYLVDDTVEVREVRRRDDGGEGGVKVPIMLKRGPLPKEFNKLEGKLSSACWD